ncbi:MAG: hypothetical protein ACPGN3_09090 [Opitutales bacterium]
MNYYPRRVTEATELLNDTTSVTYHCGSSRTRTQLDTFLSDLRVLSGSILANLRGLTREHLKMAYFDVPILHHWLGSIDSKYGCAANIG